MPSSTPASPRRWPALATWLVAAALMFALDGRVGPTPLAMLLVLASSLAGLWLSIVESLAASFAGVVAFGWAFMPPRYSFGLHMQEHGVLLVTTLAMSWITAGLM